jgi:parallel beta-helix repeat protein
MFTKENFSTGNDHKHKNHVLILVLTMFGLMNAYAQPSGGPYGPLKQFYTLPKVAGKIFYVSPDGKDDASGNKVSEPLGIEKAFALAGPGDAIILRGGIYRVGDLKVNTGITIQAFEDEEPVLKGTKPVQKSKNLGNGLWKIEWDRLFPDKPYDWWRRDRFGKYTPMHIFNNDMVFADGRLLNPVSWEGEVDSKSYYIDYENKNVYIGLDPEKHLIEITAFERGIHRLIKDIEGKKADNKGLIMRGVTITQYAYCLLEIDGHEPEGPADPSGFGKDVMGSLIEHCTLTYSGKVAAYLRGDKLVMRHCKVSDTSTEGIYLIASSDCLFEKNIFSRNNIENIIGYYPAAVKIFNQTHRVTCRDNLLTDLPLSNGIWYDVGNIDGRFINNWVEGVGSTDGPGSNNRMWPSNNGFFFEISKNAVCAGNVFVDCDHAIMILNSSNVEMYQNTFINSTVCIGRDKRSAEGDHFGWHPATGPGIGEREGHIFVNNLLSGDNDFQRPLMLIWQHPDLCEKLKQPQLKHLDNNVMVKGGGSFFHTLIYWGPYQNADCQLGIESPEEFKLIFNGSALNNHLYKDHQLPLFKSPELRDYRLLSEFPGAKVAAFLPQHVRQLLGLPGKYQPYVGAWPLR